MSIPVWSRAWTAVRAPDWWAFKIPPLLAVAYAGFIRFEGPPGRWAILACVMAAIVLVAIYGYVLNDICDVEADRAGGRPNRMAAAGPLARAAALLLPSMGALALGGSTGDAVITGLLAVNLLLPTLYSVPPVRLKGRGWPGALADAGAAHLVPTALVARAVSLEVANAGWPAALFVASAVGWAFLSGLRGIIVHQVADREADRLAGVTTLATVLGVERSRALVLRALLPLELACLALFLGLVLPGAPVAAAVVALFAVLEIVKSARGWTLPLFEPAATSRERYVPLVNNELYEVWLPLGLALQLAFLHPVAWLLVAAQLILFLPNVRTRLTEGLRAVLPAPALPTATGATQYQVIIGATTWTVNGVNVFSANLSRGLLQAGVASQVLLTEEETDLVQALEPPMPRPPGVPFRSFPVGRTDGWGMHWGAMVRYLREAAPCVYIPNSDWRHSCVCPRLPDDVVVVGIVHSDDPLHYDHVRRLGPCWNAVVAVSSAVAQRTAEACPAIAGRIVTIPIGVRIPEALPVRATTSGTLRLVYHGILKQHQKRVLDFPGIVQAARDLGVPVEMSIVGAGPDGEALREAARPLVEQGAIRFLGALSPEAAADLLEAHDVYLLASEFEGMPNALLEAMGRGCVPVVTRMTSGIPELVRDGDNGFLVPIGDAQAFAQRLRALWEDPALRSRMSASAFQTVRNGPFHVDEMVRAYRQVFDRAWEEVRSGRFKRPRGVLSPPPAEVAGVSLFPVPLPHVEPDVGSFPSVEDAEDYDDQVRAPSRTLAGDRAAAEERIRAAASRVSLDGVRVFVTAPLWTCNGINLWSEDLVRGLRKQGLDARLLLTEEATDLVRVDAPRLSRPTDLPVDELRVTGKDTWGARWGAMLGMLEAAAPCIYFPNYDWRHSCIVPALSNRVAVIGTAHDSDSLYTEHAARLGEYWNAAVATSRPIARHLRRRLPQLEDRLWTIAHGFDVPGEFAPAPRPSDGAVAVLVVHAGTYGEAEDRWITSLVQGLAPLGTFRIVAVDPPPALHGTLAALGVRVVVHPNRQEWLALCRGSRFVAANAVRGEGKRRVVEAMGHGCIPVVGGSELPPRLLRDGDNGVAVPDGRWDLAAGRIRDLASDAEGRDRMAARAHAAAREAGYRMDEMIGTYLELFRRVMATAAAGGFQRARGPIRPPPAQVDGTSIFPVALGHRTRAGPFPTAEDEVRFREEADVARAREGSPS